MVVTTPTSTELSSGYESLLGEGGTACTERDVVSVSGPDAARYLQGQLSQDVVAMASSSAWSFLLAPSGKVDAWLRVHRLDEEHYLLETDPGWGDVIAARLRRFLLRTKADISDPKRRVLLQTRWDPSIARFGADDSENSVLCAPVGPSVVGIDKLILDDADITEFENRPDSVPSGSFERYRIAHGIIRMGSELNDDTIPGEAGAWVIDASVSFTKGCYTGQELVARIDSRGNNVPHPLRLLELGVDAEVGDEVFLDGTAVGVITSAVPSLNDALPPLALARVGRSVVEGSQVAVGPTRAVALAVEPGTIR
jgi:folate-binding protein YgfZ